MRLRLNVVLTSGLVVSIGVLTLLGLLIGDDFGLLSTLVTATPIRILAQVLVRLSVVVIALTVVLGIMNLLAVNALRLFRGAPTARLGSAVVLASFLATFISYIVDRDSPATKLLLNDVQTVLETSLLGLVFFALVWGAMQVLARGVSLARVAFVATIVFVLLGALPLDEGSVLDAFIVWLMSVPVLAGARGLLLGVALATAVTGLRVLFGQDRQYGE